MSDTIKQIVDSVSIRSRATAEAAEPGSISLQNVADVLSSVDDQGVATTIDTGAGSGTVTSVAATAGGLLAVAGTPTVAPTVGIAASAAHTTIGNPTAGSAVPVAMTRTQLTAEIEAATASLPGSMSAADFSKLAAMYLLASGTALTDASATIQPGTDLASQYLAAVAETANRTTTLGVTSVVTNALVYILRTSTAAFTRAIVNGGTNGGTLLTFPASQTKPYLAGFQYNGTDWVCVGLAYLTT